MFRHQLCFNVTIKIKEFTNIHGTWSLEALHQGNGQYC